MLVNPTVAYLLLLVGLVGIAIEIFSPGLIFPGTIGVVALLLGAFGTAQLPITAAGIAAAGDRRRAASSPRPTCRRTGSSGWSG